MIAQSGQQLAQGRERAAPRLLRVGDLGGPARCLGDRLDAPQGREDPGQRPEVARQQGARLGWRQACQVTGQHVDGGVEGLVRHRLLLVAPTGQDDGLLALDQIVEVPLDQDGLARSRGAVDPQDHGPTLRHGREGIVQRAAVPLASHQRELAERGRRPTALVGVRPAPQPPQDIVPGGPGRRVAAEQVNAQRGEVVGQVGHQLTGRRGVEPLLVHHDFERAAQERQPPGQRLVEHHAHAVPVAGLRDLHTRRLLRRHVGGRPQRVPLGGLGQPLATQVGNQPEVEEYDPALRRHQHVRRLDVAVQLARVVYRRDPPSELQESVPEAPPIGRRERLGSLGRPEAAGLRGDRRPAARGLPSSSTRSFASHRPRCRDRPARTQGSRLPRPAP